MMPTALLRRRKFLWLCAAPLLGGCTSGLSLINSADVPVNVDIDDNDDDSPKVLLVGDLAGTWGMRPFKVEGIALVTGLKDTGSDPPPEPQRDMLVGNMRALEVENPNAVLASPRTSMVLVRGFLPPGVRKGDRIDVEVRVPPRSETTSLKGGWLMKTRLKEMAILEGRLRTGHEYAVGQGHVLVDAQLDGSEDPIALRRGWVLGGAVALKSRPLGLALRSGHQTVRNSSLIGAAINRRFHMFDQANIKQGVATPLRDNYIELQVHPRYQNNLWRYVHVISSVPVKESPAQRVKRMASLKRQLLIPASSARAAVKLEAIGAETIDILRRGLASSDREVRFYAAEALAYLDQAEAAPVLARFAREEPAFRWHALTALSAMDDMEAYDKLVEMLNVDSAETRYGAFRALQARNPNDPLVKGEQLGHAFSFHVIPGEGVPLVHIARSRAMEIVQFGADIRVQPPLALLDDNHLTLKSLEDGRVRVSRFAPGESDRQMVASSRLDDIVRQLVAVGASYPDVVSILHQLKIRGNLTARVEVDALPKAGRKYFRPEKPPGQPPSDDDLQVASPLPNLFSHWQADDESAASAATEEPPGAGSPAENSSSTGETEQSRGLIFGRIRR